MRIPKQLSEDELKTLMIRYYNGEKVNDLIREYRLLISPNMLTSIFPRIVHNDSPCPYCDEPMLQDPPARSSIKTYSLNSTNIYCNNCEHRLNAYCTCNGCITSIQKERLKERHKHQIKLKSLQYEVRSEAINYNDISLRDSVNLISIIRTGLCEDSDIINSLRTQSLHVCCRRETENKIILDLYNKKYIDISLANDKDDIYFDSDGKLQMIITNIEWQLHLGQDQLTSLSILYDIEKRLRNPVNYPIHWIAEIKELWRELAMEEILAFTEFQMNKHHFEARFGDKTLHVFQEILTSYPIYKIYNFIWGAVTNAVAYQVRSNISRRQAANSVIGNCQRRAEKAKAEGWQIKEYRRPPYIPVSTRVDLFRNVVTNLEERFYTEVPSAAFLK